MVSKQIRSNSEVRVQLSFFAFSSEIICPLIITVFSVLILPLMCTGVGWHPHETFRVVELHMVPAALHLEKKLKMWMSWS